MRAHLLALLPLLAFAPVAVACSATDTSTDDSASKVTDVSHTPAKDQSIGNCWVYATASWAESLHRGFAKEDLNLSESYWTYWSWFDKITQGEAESGTLQTGGQWETAAGIIEHYGEMSEGDFIPEEATVDRSARQQTALTAISTSLKTGALSTAEARRDPATVRKELDAAWQLNATVVSALNDTFGADVSKNFSTGAKETANAIVHASTAITIGTGRDANATADRTLTLADAVGTSDSFGFSRSGPFAWQSTYYPSTSGIERRHVQERVQKALHDEKPVIINWFVDFNAMDAQGRFAAPPAAPGRQGGHLTVLEDYQVSNVPGFGTLPAGVLETRPEALAAALQDSATIDFFRIKNSWGNYKSVPGTIGYHDLYLKYLDGPVQECQVDADDNPKPDTCHPATPLNAFVLPPGY